MGTPPQAGVRLPQRQTTAWRAACHYGLVAAPPHLVSALAAPLGVHASAAAPSRLVAPPLLGRLGVDALAEAVGPAVGEVLQ